MTVRNVLELADAVRPNETVDDVKIGWIGQVEGRVLCEIFGKRLDEIALPKWDEDELTIPDAYSKVYVLHVVAMIELLAGNAEVYSKLCGERDMLLSSYAKYILRSR